MKAFNIRSYYTDKDSLAMRLHLKESTHYDVLTPEQERALIERGDKDALDQLVLHNLRFVITIAKQYAAKGLSLDDLIEEGNIGLMEAAKRFKPTMKHKFISYAVWWIRQAIAKFVLDNRNVVRVPVSQQNRLKKIDHALGTSGGDMTLEEIAAKTKLSGEQVHEAMLSRPWQASLDYSGHPDEGTMADMLPSHEQENADYGLMIDDTVRTVHEALQSMPEKERTLLQMSFGIGCDWHDKQAIANKLGVSTERVRQLVKKALCTMREMCGEQLNELVN